MNLSCVCASQSCQGWSAGGGDVLGAWGGRGGRGPPPALSPVGKKCSGMALVTGQGGTAAPFWPWGRAMLCDPSPKC